MVDESSPKTAIFILSIHKNVPLRFANAMPRIGDCNAIQISPRYRLVSF